MISLISSAHFIFFFSIWQSSIWFVIPDFVVVTGHHKAFQGCWKLTKSLLKSSSLRVLTLLDFQGAFCIFSLPLCVPLWHLSSARTSVPDPALAETLNPGPLFPGCWGNLHVATRKRAVPEQLELDCAEKALSYCWAYPGDLGMLVYAAELGCHLPHALSSTWECRDGIGNEMVCVGWSAFADWLWERKFLRHTSMLLCKLFSFSLHAPRPIKLEMELGMASGAQHTELFLPEHWCSVYFSHFTLQHSCCHPSFSLVH